MPPTYSAVPAAVLSWDMVALTQQAVAVLECTLTPLMYIESVAESYVYAICSQNPALGVALEGDMAL